MNVMYFGHVPGFEESGEGKTEYCKLSSCHHCSHQETGSQVPAWLQRSEWHCK